MAQDSAKAFGTGLNSIRLRLALTVSIFVLAASGAILTFDAVGDLDTLPVAQKLAILTVAAIVTGGLTFGLTGRLTRPIEALRRSTEALAAGSFDMLSDVTCACELGGLAEAFRKMVARFNSNIIRMNVLAYSDAVTQLPNRASLNHVLAAATSRVSPAFEAGILFIDLDHFKQVNDTLGHEAGDELLRRAVERILHGGFGRTLDSAYTCLSPLGDVQDCIPDDVMLARFAGDEFVAIVPGVTNEVRLAALAERIIAALRQPFSIADTTVTIGASIGIARMPADGSDPEAILSCADMAMYAAKHAGRSRFAFFDADLKKVAQDNLQIEADLRDALEDGRVFLEYQAKVACGDLALVGVEALARFRTRDGIVRMPSEFIPVAERCGLIENLGDRVIDLAIAQGVAWRAVGKEIAIAVNVAPIQFRREGFAERLIARVAEAGLRPDLLEIEITETMAMQDFEGSRQRLQVLTDAGIRIAIDDFGTGYSNISQLVNLPYDILKVDRSLIIGAGRDHRFETVLTGIFAMAKGLGHHTVAEGIETLAQASFVNRLGCTAMQGFLFGHPMSSDQIENWLTRRSSPPALGLGDLEKRLSA